MVDEAFGRSHAPARKQEWTAAIAFAICRRDAGALRVRTGGRAGGAYMVRGHGAHGIVAPTTAAADGENIFYPAPQRLISVVDRVERPIHYIYGNARHLG